MTDHLPAARAEDGVPDTRALPAMAADFVQTIAAASEAMRYVSASGGDNNASDIEVVALTGWVCTGDAAADALQAAADLARESPQLEVVSLHWARVALPVSEDGGTVVENWEWRLTVVVTRRDPATGETSSYATEGR